jgi:hypothetical protein
MTTFYGLYGQNRNDGGKLKGYSRVVIRFQGQKRAVLDPGNFSSARIVIKKW